MKPGRRSRCYFSLRSPYSWLALRALAARGQVHGGDIEFLPYFEPHGAVRARLLALGGECLYAPMSKEKHLYLLSDVKRLLARDGLRPRWPAEGDVDWTLPHCVYLACPTPALQGAFALEAMRRRWLEGAQLCTPGAVRDVLQVAVAQCGSGADIDATLAAATDDAMTERAAAVLYEGWLDGVFGLPFLIAGRERFWGQDRIPDFLAAHEARAAAAIANN